MARWALPGLAGLAVLTLGLRSLLGSRGEIGHATAFLSHPAAGWLCLAIACEVSSYLAYGRAQRQIARAAGRELSVRWLAALSVAAQAVNNFVPGGYVAANLLNFRELRRRGLTAPASAWTLIVTSFLYVGALVGLGVAASELARAAGRQPAAVHLAAVAGLATILALGAAAVLATRPRMRRLRRGLTRGWLARLAEIRLSRRAALRSGGWFVASWLADAGCLVCSCLAIGVAVPWSTLLPIYAGAQLVAFIPLTPGGLGLVEGSLTLALGTAGGAGSKVLAAVLLYRFVSYWGTLPAGALGYLVVRRAISPGGRHEPVSALPAPV